MSKYKNDLIHVRFDLIHNAAKHDHREIARLDLPMVPALGETINLNGDPYVVKNRTWAASNEDRVPSDEHRLYAFVDVVKLGQY